MAPAADKVIPPGLHGAHTHTHAKSGLPLVAADVEDVVDDLSNTNSRSLSN